MAKGKYRLRLSALLLTVLVLILDNQTTRLGAEEGIILCLHTLIPSLLPLMFSTSLLIPYLSLESNKFDFILCKIFCVPEHSSGLLLTGLLSGYPVGARNVVQAVTEGNLSSQAGSKMMVFCNACGPAFIFGIGCNLFQSTIITWMLWTVHIASSLITARLIASGSYGQSNGFLPTAVTIPQALRRSIRSMAEICGWVILLRILVTMAERWVLKYLPPLVQIICIGILELSNGCLSLSRLSSEAMQFVLCAAFLGFGGLCVTLQSIGSSAMADHRSYLIGKLLQATVSILLAGIIHPFLFHWDSQVAIFIGIAACLMPILVFLFRKAENKSGILYAVVV